MRPENLRVLALALLGVASGSLAALVTFWLTGWSPTWLLVIALFVALCATVALLLIVSARRLEQRLMDRIDQ